MGDCARFVWVGRGRPGSRPVRVQPRGSPDPPTGWPRDAAGCVGGEVRRPIKGPGRWRDSSRQRLYPTANPRECLVAIGIVRWVASQMKKASSAICALSALNGAKPLHRQPSSDSLGVDRVTPCDLKARRAFPTRGNGFLNVGESGNPERHSRVVGHRSPYGSRDNPATKFPDDRRRWSRRKANE
jgi:hypothetical protein